MLKHQHATIRFRPHAWLIVAAFSPLGLMADTSVWSSYQKQQYDWSQDYNSAIELSGWRLGLQQSFGDNWTFSLSRSELEAEAQWLKPVENQLPVREGMQQQQDSLNLGLQWLNQAHALAISFAKGENQEAALLRLPLQTEQINSRERSLSFSYDYQQNIEDWRWDLLLGLQVVDAELDSLQQFATDPVTSLSSRIDARSTLLFSDISLDYWFDFQNYALVPKLLLGWTWQIDEDYQQTAQLQRGDQLRIIQFGADRLQQGFRQADSGFWQLSLSAQFRSGFSMQALWSRSLSSPSPSEQLALELAYQF